MIIPGSKPIETVIVGNPENRRVKSFQQALARNGAGAAKVASYATLLSGKQRIADFIKERTVIRIESPGENFEVERELIALGEEQDSFSHSCENVSAKNARQLQEDKGRIYYPAQWYRGFTRFLADIQREIEAVGHPFTWMNSPADIAFMFDKPRCWKLFYDNGINVPARLESADSYDRLRESMIRANRHRVFVKLACGSSASGVAAYEINPKKNKEQIHTTVELVRSGGGIQLYNNLKIKRSSDRREIKTIIDWICREGAHVEAWIPKERIDNEVFDLRVVVIGKKACFRVVRMSKSPMTNLHLGNRRGNVEQLKLQESTLEKITGYSEKAAALFPGSLYAGVDIMVPAGGECPVLLEINAFGDLLPGITCRGLNAYETEVTALMKKVPKVSVCFAQV
ncbi:MAG: hypothetical protein GY757_38415 [bacterium]|nr:hypothetical protein [bacterium]